MIKSIICHKHDTIWHLKQNKQTINQSNNMMQRNSNHKNWILYMQTTLLSPQLRHWMIDNTRACCAATNYYSQSTFKIQWPCKQQTDILAHINKYIDKHKHTQNIDTRKNIQIQIPTIVAKGRYCKTQRSTRDDHFETGITRKESKQLNSTVRFVAQKILFGK